MKTQPWAKTITCLGRRWRRETEEVAEDASYARKGERIELESYGEAWAATLSATIAGRYDERVDVSTDGHPSPAKALAALERLVRRLAGKAGKP